MSRIAKCPVVVPPEVDVILNQYSITIKNNKITLTKKIHHSVEVHYNNNLLTFRNKLKHSNGWAQAGTIRALVASMIIGVTRGFCKKLQLLGVGYRITINKNNVIDMSLGYSHLIKYTLPTGIYAELPSQNEIILRGADKQLVGQVAANLRSYRVPESYKGKGIRYENEIINIKEAKKK
ncbi:50S ribosomal protein L6 [Buchnera aphidicola (Eriosoma grossulariae)]|uniref:50S ribosomal protein L6 n=1 Tax=Buchnera aphidicola TaxID=9 RepID=UPI003464873A